MTHKNTEKKFTDIVREHKRLENETQQIFDLSLDMIGSGDLNGYFKKINRSFERILGYSSDEFYCHPFLHFVHDDDYERTKEALVSASRGAKTIDIENRYRCKHGEYKWIDWKVSVVAEENTFIAVGRDITTRKTLEKELRRRREVLETILDNIPVMITFVDQQGNHQLINNCYQNTLGCSLEKAKNPNIWAEFYPDPEYRKHVLEFITTSKGEWAEFQTKALNGKILDTLWTNVSLQDGFKISIGIDVTDKKMARKALLVSERRYKTITEVAQDCILCKDENRKYTFVNPAMTKLLSCSEADLIGKTAECVFEPKAAAALRELDDRTFKGEQVNEILKLLINGEETVFHIIQVPLERKDGRICSISGIYRDVTENIKAQEEKEKGEAQMCQIQKMEAIGTLAGGIAHDFNNMLGVIVGNASYAQNKLDKKNTLYSVLSNIQDGAMRAQSLTHQLLTFAKGGVPIKKVTDLNQLIQETAQFVTRGSKSKCVLDFCEDLRTAEVDSGQIHQAISNIVINASQSMPDGGTISIKTENIRIDDDDSLPLLARDYIKTTIEDTGVGISKKHLSKIFDPYFSTKQKGSGLGLATAYSIVKRHGGCMTVDSKVDQGTAFTVYLPASQKEHAIAEANKTDHKGSGRVLIMDDEEQVANMTALLLKYMGYDTSVAKDGAQAIELYRDQYQSGNPFDLVILDLTVPGAMGGARTVPELLRIDPNVKAIVSSGYSNDPIMANYADYGFCGVIPKPFKESDLAAILNKILAR